MPVQPQTRAPVQARPDTDARQTALLTAAVQALYFGLPLLLAPQWVAEVLRLPPFAEPHWVTFIGALNIALAFGAYLAARDTNHVTAILPVAAAANGLMALLFLLYLLGGLLPPPAWVSFAVAAVLAFLNGRNLARL